MHPYAFICIRHASVCTHTLPYVSITHKHVSIHHTFVEMSKHSKNSQHPKTVVAIGNFKSVQIQPNILNRPNIGTNNNKGDLVWIRYCIGCLLIAYWWPGPAPPIPPGEGGYLLGIWVGKKKRRNKRQSPKILNKSSSFEHRFGHQSGLDESSGQNRQFAWMELRPASTCIFEK